eukprot:scaffold133207_cov66-Phaeocystis_antarctica.AAC.1
MRTRSRYTLAAVLSPRGRRLRLLRHRLLPRIRLGAADGAALHKALERVAQLHGRKEPLAYRLVGHGRLDLRLRLPLEPFLGGAPLVAPAVLRSHRVDRIRSIGSSAVMGHPYSSATSSMACR